MNKPALKYAAFIAILFTLATYVVPFVINLWFAGLLQLLRI